MNTKQFYSWLLLGIIVIIYSIAIIVLSFIDKTIVNKMTLGFYSNVTDGVFYIIIALLFSFGVAILSVVIPSDIKK